MQVRLFTRVAIVLSFQPDKTIMRLPFCKELCVVFTGDFQNTMQDWAIRKFKYVYTKTEHNHANMRLQSNVGQILTGTSSMVGQS